MVFNIHTIQIYTNHRNSAGLPLSQWKHAFEGEEVEGVLVCSFLVAVEGVVEVWRGFLLS